MITTRYVQLKVPPPFADLEKAIRELHLIMEERKVSHNLLFAPMYRPFSWPKDKVKS